MNYNNEFLLKNEYEDLDYYQGYVKVRKNNLYGIIELKSKKIIFPFEYDWINLYDKNGLTFFQKKDIDTKETYSGYFNKKGKVIWREKITNEG